MMYSIKIVNIIKSISTTSRAVVLYQKVVLNHRKKTFLGSFFFCNVGTEWGQWRRSGAFTVKLWTEYLYSYFTHYSWVSIVDFEQENDDIVSPYRTTVAQCVNAFPFSTVITIGYWKTLEYRGALGQSLLKQCLLKGKWPLIKTLFDSIGRYDPKLI